MKRFCMWSVVLLLAFAPLAQAEKQKVAVIRLSNELLERPEPFSVWTLFGGPAKSPALSQLLITMDKAAKDPNLSGVLLELRGFELTLAQSEELGTLIKAIRAGGKRVTVFSADYMTPTYVLASYADTVIMPEQGNVLIPGVQMGMLFFKGLLDKLSIQADMLQVGKFKGAEEPYTRSEASPEFRQQIDRLADAFYGQMVATIAANRKMDPARAKAAIDQAWLTGKQAKEMGLVDQLLAADKVAAWLDKQFPGGVEQVRNYGEAKRESIDFSNPFAFFKLFMAGPKPAAHSTQPAVAVIYASGIILPDMPEQSDLAEGLITPSLIRKSLEKIAKEDQVKAIVLRVDSPGGSASASDEIWQMLKDADKTKPVTVSMGRVAASGGYYISCGARSITADPSTITGSIGVVGGKLVLSGLLDKIGVNIQPVYRGKRASIFSMTKPFTEDERGYIRKQMEEVYDLFTSRVKAGRGDKIKDIAAVAQGRLFDGDAAVKAGLVDQTGTLRDTVQAAAKTAGIADNYQVLTYPEPKSLVDLLRDAFSVELRLPVGVSTAVNAMPPAFRREAMRALTLMNLVNRERVMLSAPIGIVE